MMALACNHNVALVPIGGGTNVTGALELSANETRMIVSLDMSQMVIQELFSIVLVLKDFTCRIRYCGSTRETSSLTSRPASLAKIWRIA